MMTDNKGCLYLIHLNKTSFSRNPGRMELPAGTYIAEVRGGVFRYSDGYTVDVEVSYNDGSKRRTVSIPNMGKVGEKNHAEILYQGTAIEFTHSGGLVEVYNPRPASRCFGKVDGNVDVAIWDGSYFGASVSTDSFENVKSYAPSGNNRLLVLTSNPHSEIYKTFLNKYDVDYNSNLDNIESYNAVVVPQEGFATLYIARDHDTFSKYTSLGGRLFLVGAAPYYLGDINFLPQPLPMFLGGGEYSTIKADKGSRVVLNGDVLLAYNTPVTMPVTSSTCFDCCSVTARFDDLAVGRRVSMDSGGRVVWTSCFYLPYVYADPWNNFITSEINWLIS